MKSDVILVSNTGDQIAAVLEQTEKAAVYKDLSHKCAVHVRLLAEEMMGMMRAIAGEAEGKFWIESEGDVFELHLQVQKNMDAWQRKQLLSASSSGVNEANRGLMGKIRMFFEPTDLAPVFYDILPGGWDGEMNWTMCAYQEEVLRAVQQSREEAAEAWDELEKSVVSHVADDVKVSIRDHDAEMIVFKKIE